MNKIINIRTAALTLVALFTIAFSTPALAIDEVSPKVELKFIGNLENQPVFELHFNGTADEVYTVAVLDRNNNLLYKEVLKSTTSKKFMLNTEELGDADIRFEITGRKSNKTVVYEVNRSSRLVQDLVVNKLK